MDKRSKLEIFGGDVNAMRTNLSKHFEEQRKKQDQRKRDRFMEINKITLWDTPQDIQDKINNSLEKAFSQENLIKTLEHIAKQNQERNKQNMNFIKAYLTILFHLLATSAIITLVIAAVVKLWSILL